MKRLIALLLMVGFLIGISIPVFAAGDERKVLDPYRRGEYYIYKIPESSEPLDIVIKAEGGTLTIQGDTAYLYLESMSNMLFSRAMNDMRPFKIKKIVIDLFSFGGSLFDALAMASLMRDQEASGKTIEIRARGLVASAGLIILVSGTKDHRYIHPISMVMFHELKSLTIAYDSPSEKEETAKIERFIQEQVNQYIVDRSKISIQELRERIQRREFWMDSKTTIRYGFADKLLK